MHVLSVRHVHAEDDSASSRCEISIGFHQQTVAQGYIHRVCELAFDKIAMSDFHVIKGQIAGHAPACNGTQVTVRNHLAHVPCVTDLLKYFAESLLITAPRRGSETDQVAGNVGFEQAEVIEDAPVARCDCVVRFINNHDGELIRLQPRQASAAAS